MRYIIPAILEVFVIAGLIAGLFADDSIPEWVVNLNQFSALAFAFVHTMFCVAQIIVTACIVTEEGEDLKKTCDMVIKVHGPFKPVFSFVLMCSLSAAAACMGGWWWLLASYLILLMLVRALLGAMAREFALQARKEMQ